MTASDEEITRSATPRFALETALIRLATLPKTLPVGELIDRLESLEGKFTGASRPTAAPPVRVAEQRPPAPAPAAMPRAKPEAIAAGGGASNSWQGFIAFVGKEKRPFSPYLESATALELPPGPLSIGIGERYHLTFWQDGDNLATLKELAKKFFSQDVALQITAVGADSVRQSADSATAAAAGSPAERSDMVKEALRIFGGSVRNVRRESG
jgi:hypothetical protein